MAQIVTITNPLTGQPAQVDQLDHTAQEIDDGIARALPGGAIDQRVSMLPGQNLLDNSVFVDGCLVDQRQGRVVKPNTTYYSDNQLTTSAGTTSAYVTAYRYATGTASGVSYASFKLEDTDTAPTYYAAPENVVRGYTGAGYGPDRWMIAYNQNNFAVLITDTGLSVSGNAVDGPFIMQRFDRDSGKILSGKTVTFSVLTTNGLYSETAVFPVENASDVPLVDNADIFMYFQWSQNSANLPCAVFVMRNADIKYIAAKLELGSQQTLAHQDENGNWVLNELPNYADTLARCQRYFVRMSNVYASGHQANGNIAVVDLVTPVPMRTNPVINVARMGLLSNNQTIAAPNSIILAALIQNHVYLIVNTSENMTFGNAVCLHDADINLSAEL